MLNHGELKFEISNVAVWKSRPAQEKQERIWTDIKLANKNVNMLAFTFKQITISVRLLEMVEREASMLDCFRGRVVGFQSKTMSQKNPEKFEFCPKEFFKQIGHIYGHLVKNDSDKVYPDVTSNADWSYDVQLFIVAVDAFRGRGEVGRIIQEFVEIEIKAKVTIIEAISAETILGDTPNELLDYNSYIMRREHMIITELEVFEHILIVKEMVFLKLKQYRQVSVGARINRKFSARYYGSFQIIDRVGEVAYRLKLPPSSLIHPVFHVSLLKKAVGDYSINDSLPEDLGVEDLDVFEPQEVLVSRIVSRQGDNVTQWLIQWKGKRVEDATWEDEMMIKGQFPDFSLVDKTAIPGGGIDTAQVTNGPWAQVSEALKNVKRWGRVFERKKGAGVREERDLT